MTYSASAYTRFSSFLTLQRGPALFPRHAVNAIYPEGRRVSTWKGLLSAMVNFDDVYKAKADEASDDDDDDDNDDDSNNNKNN
jgi:hypothetical protein